MRRRCLAALLLAPTPFPAPALARERPATLTVGAGQQFATVAAAVAASQDGDTIAVQAGTYLNDFAEIGTRIRLRAVGGMAHMLATVAPPNGRAILVADADLTVDGFEFSGSRVPALIGAGIQQQGGALTVLNSYFHDNQTGILASAEAAVTLSIRNSEFARSIASGTTAETGLTHGLYAGRIARLAIDHCYFHEASIGHQIKSRAAETIIANSRIADFGSTSSYSVDLPNGGKALLLDNVIEQGPNSEERAIVVFGAEGNLYANSSLLMQGNTVINRLPHGLMLWNAARAPASVAGTRVFGLGPGQLVRGPAAVTDTTFLSAAPAFNTSSQWGASSAAAGSAPPGLQR